MMHLPLNPKQRKCPTVSRVNPGKDLMRTYTVAEQASRHQQWDSQNPKTNPSIFPYI